MSASGETQWQRAYSFFGAYMVFYILSAIATAPIALLFTPACNIAFGTDFSLLEGFVVLWGLFAVVCVTSLFFSLMVSLGKD